MLTKISVTTKNQTEFIDVTSKVQDVVKKSGVQNGICQVFAPHTTAAVTINENADPRVSRDILYEINKVIPFSDNYRHTEGNSAAHIKSSIFGASELIPIEDGRLVLGTWQGIYFCEFDGPRPRSLYVNIIADRPLLENYL